MTSPEFEPTPDTTPQFLQAYGTDRTTDENVQNILLGVIESDEGLMTTLREYLQQDDMTLEEAIGRTVADVHDRGLDDQIQDAVDSQREMDSIQREQIMATVGLQPSGETISGVEIGDIGKFTAALQNARVPENPETAAILRDELTEAIDNRLFTLVIAAKDLPSATIAEPPEPQLPVGLLETTGITEDDRQQLRDRLNIGSDELDATVTQSGRLADAIDNLGLPAAYSRGFRHLQIAASEGVVREWAAAHDAGLYAATAIGDSDGDVLSGRYTTDSEREQAVAIIGHLQETIPGTNFVKEVTLAMLDDVQKFLDTPFDPEAGEPLTQLDVHYHDQDHGRIPEIPEDGTPDAADATEPEDPMPENPDDIEHLFKDFGIIIVEEEHDLPLEWPQVPGLEPASPEDSCRVRRETHDEMVIGFTSMRDQILTVLPQDEQRRFRLKQANSAMERVQAAGAEGTSVSVGDIAAIIIGQETALETITAYLAEAGESVINAQATVEGILGDASSTDAITAINAIAAALESLKKGREHIVDGLTHFKHYNP